MEWVGFVTALIAGVDEHVVAPVNVVEGLKMTETSSTIHSMARCGLGVKAYQYERGAHQSGWHPTTGLLP